MNKHRITQGIVFTIGAVYLLFGGVEKDQLI